MKQKRAIITLYEDDHTDLKTYCSSVGADIQTVGVDALNEYFSQRGVNINLTTPSKENDDARKT